MEKDNMETNEITYADVLQHAETKYNTKPEHVLPEYPNSDVLIHPNGNIYGILMNVPGSELGLKCEIDTDILVVRCSPFNIPRVLGKKAYKPAYIMNRHKWVSVLLNGSATRLQALIAVDASYRIAEKAEVPDNN